MTSESYLEPITVAPNMADTPHNATRSEVAPKPYRVNHGALSAVWVGRVERRDGGQQTTANDDCTHQRTGGREALLKGINAHSQHSAPSWSRLLAGGKV